MEALRDHDLVNGLQFLISSAWVSPLGLWAAELLETVYSWIFAISRTGLRYLTLDIEAPTCGIRLWYWIDLPARCSPPWSCLLCSHNIGSLIHKRFRIACADSS